MKKLSKPQLYRSFAISAILTLILFLMTGITESTAQYIENDRLRRDVRATARRTARRVNRRHDIMRAVVGGSILYALPGGCLLRAIAGINYHFCNGLYYQPQYQGTQVVYVQVNIDD